MASTNSYNYVETRDNFITDALLHIGAIDEGETPSANAVTNAARLLNMIVKHRASDGMLLWALKRGTILPFTDSSVIATNSHVVVAYTQTTLSADEASGQTVITGSLTDVSDLAQDDNIGIELDDGSMHWTTVAAVAPEINLADALPSAASSGNNVYWYTASADRIQRPLQVIEANVKDITNNTTTDLEILDRSSYFSLSNKTVEGIPNSLYYDAILGTAVADPATATTWYGNLYIYPRFQNGDHVIEFTYSRPFQDFDASSDHPDCPQEFYLAWMLELASLLASRYGVPLDERKQLVAEATAYRQEALTLYQPAGSILLQPSDESDA